MDVSTYVLSGTENLCVNLNMVLSSSSAVLGYYRFVKQVHNLNETGNRSVFVVLNNAIFIKVVVKGIKCVFCDKNVALLDIVYLEYS